MPGNTADDVLYRLTEPLQDLPCRRQGKAVLSQEQLRQAAAQLLEEAGLAGLLSGTLTATTTQWVRGYRGQPGRQETAVAYTLTVQRDESAIAGMKRTQGWQVYATNQRELGLAAVVWGYRGQYRIEDDGSRLKGRPLALTPLYLQSESRLRGLLHWLGLCLRVLCLLEWQVRQGLSSRGEELRGLYAGQAGRKTSRPSAELLLRAFVGQSVSVVEVGGAVVVLTTALSPLQQRLLRLWDLPDDLFQRLTLHFPEPPPTMSER